MNLDKYLLNFTLYTNTPSLDGMNYFMSKFDNPHKKLKFIHVAGTNGKGSICEMLSNILVLSDYKVGKYISPYLSTANESLCINNKYINDSDISEYINCIESVREDFKTNMKREPTRYEVLTTICILYFFDNNCDIAIFEVGLGGRLDCTNIITPIVSLFGTISFDHTDILGNTLSKIAYEKAGIIKRDSNSVIFEQEEVLSIIEEKCKLENNSLHIIHHEDILNYHYDINYQYFDYKDLYNIEINLKGKKQIENASIVIEAVHILNNNGFNIDNSNILNGLKTVIHHARFEILKTNPLIIFDGAHNENAITNFIETVKNYYPNYDKCFVLSILKTKDYKSILEKLLLAFPKSKFILTSGIDENKFLSKENLFEYSKNLSKNIYTNNFEVAIHTLSSEINFIIGSFYTYAKVREILNEKK